VVTYKTTSFSPDKELNIFYIWNVKMSGFLAHIVCKSACPNELARRNHSTVSYRSMPGQGSSTYHD